jgi:hypothetical protein
VVIVDKAGGVGGLTMLLQIVKIRHRGVCDNCGRKSGFITGNDPERTLREVGWSERMVTRRDKRGRRLAGFVVENICQRCTACAVPAAVAVRKA